MESPETPAVAHTRRARARAAAAARGVPLATIIVSVVVVAATYLAGKLIYRLRDAVLIMVLAGFFALILNPPVLYVQRRWTRRRRGLAVAVVTVWAALVFSGVVVAFGYPLVNGVTHFSHQLPSCVSSAEHGHGAIGALVRAFTCRAG